MAQQRKQIGRYQLMDELGRGAMGMVFSAMDPVIDRIVALKTIDLNVAPDLLVQFRERLLQEAKAAGRLNHPNIVSVFDAGEEEGLAYIVMERVLGRSLRDALSDESPIPAKLWIDISIQLADALAYAHKAGIVHRDVKPENVMLTDEGQVRLTDFGIARIAESPSRTLPGKVFGSPRYMSPEQICGRAVDHRSDIFSLGAVMYEMATGRPAFGRHGEDSLAVAAEITTTDPKPPKAVSPLITDALDLLIRRALAKDPQDRYQDAAQLLRDLRELSKVTMPEYELTKTLVLDEAQLASASLGKKRSPFLFSHADIWKPGQKLKTYISTVLFADIVGYSLHPVPTQAEVKHLFVQAVSVAVEQIPEEERMILDTGDGAAFSFHGNPCHALETALRLLEWSEKKDGDGIALRLGINTGPVQLVTGVNKQFDLVGDGINDAQRVMSFSMPGQIIVSRIFHDIASRIMLVDKECFIPVGRKCDKHGRPHDLLAFNRSSKEDSFSNDPVQTNKDYEWKSLQTKLIADIQSFKFSEEQLHAEAVTEKNNLGAYGQLKYPSITEPGHQSNHDAHTAAYRDKPKGLLAQLAQESSRIRITDQDQAMKALQQTDAVVAQLDSLMREHFSFWNDFVSQLNVIKPPIPRQYSLLRIGTMRGLRWNQGFADFRTRVLNDISVIDRIAVSISLIGPGHLETEREIHAAEQFQQQLVDFNLPFTSENMQNERGRNERVLYRIPSEVRVSMLFVADHDRRAIRFYSRNLERLGSAEIVLTLDSFNKADFDEIGKLILGRASRFILSI